MTTESLKARCHDIKYVFTDVDGVLTDGGMYYSEKGDELKKFNVRDGTGFLLLRLAGIKVGVLTGENTELVRKRAEKVKCDFYKGGAVNKRGYLEDLIQSEGIEWKNIAYLGDEINDCPLLGKVGIFFAVSDACLEILRGADYTLSCRGGQGALREAACFILSTQDKLEECLQRYYAAASTGKLF